MYDVLFLMYDVPCVLHLTSLNLKSYILTSYIPTSFQSLLVSSYPLLLKGVFFGKKVEGLKIVKIQKYFLLLSLFILHFSFFLHFPTRFSCFILSDIKIKHKEKNSLLSLFCSIQGFLQKGGIPATPSGTATLLRLSPSH